MRADLARIRRYYDRHTPAWVAFGPGGTAIHRAVWGPGVHTRQQSFRYVEDRIVEVLLGLAPSFGSSHVVDLGCGVGGSLCYLAERLPVRGTGITLSPVQARLARERIAHAGCADRLRCLVGDYSNLPDDIPSADLAFAIESFVHAPDPARFLEQCRLLVRPGGLLVICDDFRRLQPADSEDGVPQAPASAEHVIERFRRGWHINTLISAAALRALAREAGFEHQWTLDLTPSLELGRIRDRVVEGVMKLAGWLPLERTRLGYLLGGSALQTCLANGWIGYDLVVFRRR
jgi:SAM-dependent methyltransferase